MMTNYEIIQLRRAGKIEEAYHGCNELLQAYPDDHHVREQMMWCLKSLCEIAANNRNPRLFSELFNRLTALRLHEIGLVNGPNRFAWDIKKLFDGLACMPQQLLRSAEDLFAIIRQLQFFKPSKNYSLLADSFLKVKGPQNTPWTAFTDFMDWFGFDNLMSENYLPIRLSSGNTMMSLAERLHIGYYKALKAKIDTGFIDENRIERFLNRLTRLNETHPEFKFSLYHKGQLLLSLGRKDEALKSIIPFVRRHQKDFWVWDLLGDSVDDLPLRLSCYCRGLSCPTEDGYLGKLRLKTADSMHRAGHDSNAKKELLILQSVYQNKGWTIPREVLNMLDQTWCKEIKPAESNKEFYNEQLDLSEEFLFTDIPEHSVLITYVNREKKICNFIDEQRIRGFFSFKRLRRRLNENTIFKIRFDGEPQNNQMAKLLTIKPVSDLTPYIGVFFKKIEGDLKIPHGRSYGFVGDILINEELITSNLLSNGDKLIGTAVITYERRRERFGWKAIRLVSHS